MGYLVSILTGLFGIWVGILLERKKIRKGFYSDYYEDLWDVIRNIDSIIQRVEIIRSEKVMINLHRNYSTSNISVYLQKSFRTDDKKLRRFLDDFVSNMNEFNKLLSTSLNAYGDLQPEKIYKVKRQEYKKKSKQITDKIQKRINHLIVK